MKIMKTLMVIVSVVEAVCDIFNIADNFKRLDIVGVHQTSARSVPVDSVTACCVYCSQLHWCWALTYHGNTCHMYASAVSPGTSLCLNSEHFRKMKGHIGADCAEDDDCGVVKSVCFYGKCRCVPGYSFNPGDGTCLRHCTRYGSSMSSYPGIGITEHNLRAKKNTAIQECVKDCVSEKTFLCVSADTFSNDDTCNMQAVGYLDVHKSSRESGETNWTYLHRDCAIQERLACSDRHV